MSEELKDYRAPLGAFQLIDPDVAVFALCICIALGAILAPYL